MDGGGRQTRNAWLRGAASVVLGLAPVAHAAADGAAAQRCAALAGRAVDEARVVAAEAVEPDPVWRLDYRTYRDGSVTVHRPFCRVEGTIEGNIGFELWLPDTSHWTGRMLGAGVGGSGGTFNYVDLARGVDQGFAAATTDTGHKFTDEAWMLDDKAARDFTHRAQHLLAVTARRLIRDYYGQPAEHAYFIGCSGGGRQGLKEMQRYPGDYDGIIAGAPGPDNPVLSARHLITALRQQNAPGSALTAEDWQLVEDHVTQQCDAVDGLEDGLVTNPKACTPDFQALACRGSESGESQDCLSAARLDMLADIYAPLEDEHGARLDQGLLPGLRARPGPPPPLILEMFGQVVHGREDWDPRDFMPSRDVRALHDALPDMRADDPDVTAFRARGGKAILYHGWWDSSVLAQGTIDYYASVAAGPAAEDVDDLREFMRLFMVPGVYHCRGGPGPDRFGGFMSLPVAADPAHDLLRALVRWVEDGVAPDRLVASRTADSRVRFQRPLCPYPESARYVGGDVRQAGSFACRTDTVLEQSFER